MTAVRPASKDSLICEVVLRLQTTAMTSTDVAAMGLSPARARQLLWSLHARRLIVVCDWQRTGNKRLPLYTWRKEGDTDIPDPGTLTKYVHKLRKFQREEEKAMKKKLDSQGDAA